MDKYKLDPGNYTGSYESDSGQLSLDFSNTVNWRKGERRQDGLESYDSLAAWGVEAGLLTAGEAGVLVNRAEQQPEAAQQVLERAIDLREAIYRLFSSLAAGHSPGQADLEHLNVELQAGLRHLQVVAIEEGCAWAWERASTDLDCMLWPVARAAAELLVSPEIERVGECSAEECGWLFLDMSKNHSRRWCDMNGCGNRAKARQHYRRKKLVHSE